MTTVVNNPPPTNDSNGGMGMIIGVIVLIVIAYIFFMYGLPAIKQMGSPQINIPNKINVNVKQIK
jgi:hypothetical protein